MAPISADFFRSFDHTVQASLPYYSALMQMLVGFTVSIEAYRRCGVCGGVGCGGVGGAIDLLCREALSGNLARHHVHGAHWHSSFIHTHTHVYICICIHMYMYTYTCVCVCVCVCVGEKEQGRRSTGEGAREKERGASKRKERQINKRDTIEGRFERC